jgi:hypothetical protein
MRRRLVGVAGLPGVGNSGGPSWPTAAGAAGRGGEHGWTASPPLGLGIGRLVFRALAVAELALAVALTVALALPNGTGVVDAATWTLTALLWAVLAVQVGVLRPRLDQRARRVVAGENLPGSRLHLAYVALEGIKVVLLSVVGVVLVAGIAS